MVIRAKAGHSTSLRDLPLSSFAPYIRDQNVFAARRYPTWQRMLDLSENLGGPTLAQRRSGWPLTPPSISAIRRFDASTNASVWSIAALALLVELFISTSI